MKFKSIIEGISSKLLEQDLGNDFELIQHRRGNETVPAVRDTTNGNIYYASNMRGLGDVAIESSNGQVTYRPLQSLGPLTTQAIQQGGIFNRDATVQSDNPSSLQVQVGRRTPISGMEQEYERVELTVNGSRTQGVLQLGTGNIYVSNDADPNTVHNFTTQAGGGYGYQGTLRRGSGINYALQQIGESKSINENLADLAHKAEMDHEVQMARADLYKLAKYSIKLHEILKGISEAEGLEGWQQAKITKAADYISSVYHSLEYDVASQAMPESKKGPDDYKLSLAEKVQKKLSEKAVSQNQQQAAGIALKHKREGTRPQAGTASASMMSMSVAELEKIASTKHQGLPDTVASEGERHGNDSMYDKCWDGYERVPGTRRGEKGSCRIKSS